MTVWPALMRASRPNPEKKTKINVAFINGSYTFGEGVRDRDTMVWKLNEKYPDITFDNFAVPGYGPLQCTEHLKKHVFSHNQYDLICYNINYGNLLSNAYAHVHSGKLTPNSLYIIAPYSAENLFGRWHNYNSFNDEWPCRNRLLCLDLIWRFCLSLNGPYNYSTHTDRKEIIKENWKKAYAYQIREMEKLCRAHNSDFAIFALEKKIVSEVFPNIGIKSPKVDIAFAKIEDPEYRVLQKSGFHPNAFVHAYWAERFSEWFDKEYLPKKSMP
ncbi:hypothetical protein IJT93_06065 [bacterium]|nr:hypothetical protein [bacterium]